MRYGKLLMCVVPLLAFAACKDDTGISPPAPIEPMALARFINTVPDTGTVDFRFVDYVENLPTFQSVAFRSHSGMYQRVGHGTRPVRVFPNAADPDLTQIRLVDTELTLAADQRYTLLYSGRASASAPAAERHQLTVIADPAPPTPPANMIAFQALHGAVGVGPVDVYIVPVATTTAATPADWQTTAVGVLRNVPFRGKAAGYVNVPVRTGTTFYRFVVTAAGSDTPLFAATPNEPGVAATVNVPAQPGVRIAGSVMTAVIAPGSTPGTRQSTTANQTPTVFLLKDKTL